MRTVQTILDRGAEQHPHSPAVSSSSGSTLTYEELRESVGQFVRWLEQDSTRGALVLVPANEPVDIVSILAAMVSGRLLLVADPAWTTSELSAAAERAGAGALLVPTGNRLDLDATVVSELDGRQLRRLASQPIDHPGVAIGRFTSGTTGAPRCLGFTTEAIFSAADTWRRAAQIDSRDVVLCLATLNNGLAFNTSVLSVLSAGAHLVLHAGRPIPSSILRVMRTFKPSILVAFPFAFDVLVRADPDCFKGLRLAMSSAAPLSPATGEQWVLKVGVPICNYYGLAEVGPVTFNLGDRPGSVGVPLDGVEVAFDADASGGSRIRLRTRSMASRYLDDLFPELQESIDNNGYFLTKDLGHLKDGNLYLDGRVGGIVNIAGRKIDPTEVGEVIRALATVDDVVVRGEGAAEDQVLAAYVESATATRVDIIEHCRAHLADYKLPQKVLIVSRFPRNSAGKVSASALGAV